MAQVIQNNDWKSELNKTILKYHTIALWVAVIFDLLFFVTDYFNVYDYWQEFLIFRVSVSFICLITVLFHKKFNLDKEILGVIPVLLISVQNAYMWSVMDVLQFQQHAFAYIALFIGSGMFIFYHVYYSIFIVLVNIILNIIFFYFNSSLTLDEILVNGGFLTGAVAIFSIILIRMRYRLTKKEVIARHALEQSKREVEEKNHEILDSINYAKRIQSAILPPLSMIADQLPESFVLYKPKDIVAGDFYWIESLSDKIFFAAADCTGHGVPGAMVSVICNNGLNRSVREYKITEPGKILDKTCEIVIQEFEKSEEDVRDGMDIALCSLSGNKLQYAGANNPLWIIRDKELIEIKADRKPIGKSRVVRPFTTHSVNLNKGDCIYIFTDGFADQFGGDRDKKYMTGKFKKFILSICDLSLEEQKKAIEQEFIDWKGDLEQIDDVCVMGVRV